MKIFRQNIIIIIIARWLSTAIIRNHNLLFYNHNYRI